MGFACPKRITQVSRVRRHTVSVTRHKGDIHAPVSKIIEIARVLGYAPCSVATALYPDAPRFAPFCLSEAHNMGFVCPRGQTCPRVKHVCGETPARAMPAFFAPIPKTIAITRAEGTYAVFCHDRLMSECAPFRLSEVKAWIPLVRGHTVSASEPSESRHPRRMSCFGRPRETHCFAYPRIKLVRGKRQQVPAFNASPRPPRFCLGSAKTIGLAPRPHHSPPVPRPCRAKYPYPNPPASHRRTDFGDKDKSICPRRPACPREKIILPVLIIIQCARTRETARKGGGCARRHTKDHKRRLCAENACFWACTMSPGCRDGPGLSKGPWGIYGGGGDFGCMRGRQKCGALHEPASSLNQRHRRAYCVCRKQFGGHGRITERGRKHTRETRAGRKRRSVVRE
jgi:hypothetical protein